MRIRKSETTVYPAVRDALRNGDSWDDDQVERLLEQLFPDSDPDDVEDFMQGLQKFGRQAAPVVQRALPGAIQGAAQGAAIGGPWGALAGAAAGGAIGALSSPAATPTAPTAPRATPPPRRPPSAPAAPGAVPPPLPRATPPALTAGTPAPAPGGAAAAQLLALLSRPETLQALMALVLSTQGRTSVPVNGRRVPPAAFAEAIAELAGAALEMASESATDATAEHLLDEYGTPRIDIASPVARTQLLLTELAESPVEVEDDDEEREDWMWEYDGGDDEYDPIEAYENAVTGRTAI